MCAQYNILDFIDPGMRQDVNAVTAGIQAAIVAWYHSGGPGEIIGPPGVYPINKPVFGGITSAGKSVQRHIADNDLSATNGIQPTLTCSFSPSCIFVVDADFTDDDYLDGHFPDRVCFRWQHGTKQPRGIVGKLPYLFWAGDREDRYKCPTGFKFRRLNLCNLDFQAAGPRGKDGGWAGTPVHFDDLNNTGIENLRTRGGSTPLFHEVYQGDGQMFSVNDPDTDKVVDAGTRFLAPPEWPASDRDFFRYSHVALTGDFDTDFVSAQVSWWASMDGGSTVNVSHDFAQTDPDVNIAFPYPTCSVAEGGNTATFLAPVLHPDMEGRLVAIEAQRDNRGESRLMTGYIGAIIDAFTCEIVGEHGGPVAFGETKTAAITTSGHSGAAMFLPGGVALTQCYDSNYRGSQNNDISFRGMAAEAGEGGALLIQAATRCFVDMAKGHGRNGKGGAADLDFTKCGTCLWVDDSEYAVISGAVFSWANYIDPATGRASLVKVTGNDIRLTLRDIGWNGSADKMDVIDATNCAGNWTLTLAGGESRFKGWGGDMAMVAGPHGANLSNHVFSVAPTIERGGQGDMTAEYRITNV